MPESDAAEDTTRSELSCRGHKHVIVNDEVNEVLSQFVMDSVHPFLVFEKTIPLFLQTKNVKMDTAYLGGLHQSRLDSLLGIHIVEPCMKQVYFGRRLDKSPHYQICQTEIVEFVKTALAAAIPVFTYANNRTYYNRQDFLSVLNWNTTEWMTTELDCKLDGLQRCGLQELLLNEECERGNIQIACGYTPQNYDSSAKTGLTLVEKPALTKATTPGMLGNMMLMTDVCNILEATIPGCNGIFCDASRNNNFAFEIGRHLGHPQPERNRLEGYTMALTRSTTNVLKCHLDTLNDTVQGYDMVVVASYILSLPKSSTGRVSHIAYGRACCRHFMHRSEKTKLFCNDLMSMLAETPKTKRVICCELYPTSGDEFRSMAPHYNKNVYYSTFASAIIRLNSKYNLTRNQAIELLYGVSFFNGSWLYWNIMKKWWDRGIPGDGICLSVSMLQEAVHRGGVSTGRFRRHQCSFNQRITLQQIYTNLARLRKVLDEAENPKSNTQALIQSLSKNASDGGLLHCGMLTAQHLLQVAVLSGIVENTAHNINAEISDGTLLKKRLEEYGCHTREQCNRLLKDASRFIGQTPKYTENAMCEKLRPPGKSFDVVYPDEVLMDTNDLGSGLVVVEYSRDGSVKQRPKQHWVNRRKGECADKWWDNGFKCNHHVVYQVTTPKVVTANGKKQKRKSTTGSRCSKQHREALRIQRFHQRVSMQSRWAAKPLPDLVSDSNPTMLIIDEPHSSGKKRLKYKIIPASKRYRADEYIVRNVWLTQLPINSSSRRRFPTLIDIRSKVYSREYIWKRVDLFMMCGRVIGERFTKKNLTFPDSPRTICGRQGWVASTELKNQQYSTARIARFPVPFMKMGGEFYYQNKQKAIHALLIGLLCEFDKDGVWIETLLGDNEGVVLCNHFKPGPMHDCSFATIIRYSGFIYILDHEDERSYDEHLRIY